MSKGQRKGGRKNVLGRGHCRNESLAHEREHSGFEEIEAVSSVWPEEREAGKCGRAKAGWQVRARLLTTARSVD